MEYSEANVKQLSDSLKRISDSIQDELNKYACKERGTHPVLIREYNVGEARSTFTVIGSHGVAKILSVPDDFLKMNESENKVIHEITREWGRVYQMLGFSVSK